MNAHFNESRLMILPLLSFASDLNSTIYTLKKLEKANLYSSSAANKKFLDFFGNSNFPIELIGHNTNLYCTLTDKIHMMKPKTEPQLLHGEWEALGMWFETGLVPDEEDVFHPGYIVSGKLEVKGSVVAHHKQMPSTLTHLHKTAWTLIEELQKSGCFPLSIEIEDSQITRILTQNDDNITSDFLKLTNESYDLMLLEVAFSGKSGLETEKVDWLINSVVNEGLKGIHIGIGDGITGAHIDFIAPDVIINNVR